MELSIHKPNMIMGSIHTKIEHRTIPKHGPSSGRAQVEWLVAGIPQRQTLPTAVAAETPQPPQLHILDDHQTYQVINTPSEKFPLSSCIIPYRADRTGLKGDNTVHRRSSSSVSGIYTSRVRHHHHPGPLGNSENLQC
jgi:hypothetical protein